jgi:hypothetical protein
LVLCGLSQHCAERFLVCLDVIWRLRVGMQALALEQGQGLHPDPQAPNDIQTHQEAFRAMLRQSAQDHP